VRDITDIPKSYFFQYYSPTPSPNPNVEMFGLFDICKHPKAPVHAGKPFLWASILNAYAISTAVASVAVISWEDWDGQVVKPNPTQIVLSSLGLGLNIISAIAIILHINNRWISETIKLIFVSSLLSGEQLYTVIIIYLFLFLIFYYNISVSEKDR